MEWKMPGEMVHMTEKNSTKTESEAPYDNEADVLAGQIFHSMWLFSDSFSAIESMK